MGVFNLSRILLFGNSGSGESTLVKTLCAVHGLAHLDLDTLAWQPKTPPERQPLAESKKHMQSFLKAHNDWVIEGCYTDLLELAAPYSSKIIFMNLPVDLCMSNAKMRPWEPHKYSSKVAQDANLNMLIKWISMYTERDDAFSETAHSRFYKQYSGHKIRVTNNQRTPQLILKLGSNND